METILNIGFGITIIGLFLCCILCVIGIFVTLIKPIIKQFKKK